ncbi:MAG: hypothetical protein AB1941_08335 [Gemmatimonadota bacterium]
MTVRKVRELGDASGPGRLDPALYSAATDSRGNVLVASGLRRPVSVFGPDGRFLRTLGDSVAADSLAPVFRLATVGRGDTVHLVDDRNLRRLVLGPDFHPVRSVATSPFALNSGMALLLPDDGMLLTGIIRTRENIGYPLHLAGRGGEIVRSFGTDAPEDTPESEINYRRLAHAGPGRAWSGHMTRYVLERWTLDGRRELRIERDAPWFAPYADVRRLSPADPPRPMLMAVRQDAAGRLWTVVRVADPQWRRTVPSRSDTASRAPLTRPDTGLDDLYDTVVEVFDPACGRLLASERLPAFMIGFLDDEHLLEWRVNGAAPPRLGVWRVGLNLPSGRRTTC